MLHKPGIQRDFLRKDIYKNYSTETGNKVLCSLSWLLFDMVKEILTSRDKNKQVSKKSEKERLTDSSFVYAFPCVIILSILRKNY